MGDQRNLFQKIFGLGQRPVTQAPPNQTGAHPAPVPGQAAPAQPSQAQNQPADQNQDNKKKKPGFWGRLFGKKDDSQPQQTQSPPQ
jgi:penicillin-binding protein 1B